MSYKKVFTEAYRDVVKNAMLKEQEANKLLEQEKDHEISMARGELEAIADKAMKLSSMLQGKSDEGNPLEAWVQSKITKAKDYINSVADYMEYNPDMANEETILEYTQQQIKQAYGILNDPRYKGGNYDGAVKAIEKLAKGLSNHPDVKNALKRANEDVEGRPSPTNPTGKDLEEAMSHTVRFTDPLNKKRFAIPFKTHKAAEDKMAQLKKDGVKEIKITMDELKPGIKFAEMVEEKTPAIDPDKRSEGEKNIKKEEGDDKEKLKAEIEKKDDQIQALKVKAETEKAKQAKKETERLVNPETGEPLLQVGIAYKHLRDKMKKEEVKLDEAESYGLMGRMSDSQIQNIKKVWAKKTPKDVTQGVKDMIKKMDIPTQLAIKVAKINVLSDLIEDVDLEEKSIKDIFKANKEGESADEIAKRLKMPISRVKSILGESHYKVNSHVMVKGKQGQIVRVDTPETGAYYTVKMDDGNNIQCKPEDIKLVEETQLDEFTSSMIKDLQKSYADLKGKTISPEKANALSKHLDRLDVSQLKQLVTANIPFVTTIAKNKLYRKTGKFEGAKAIVEQIAAVKSKAEKSGMPYSILKQVYDRGMAAWRGGHRPGATQVQWALARVNSFVTKSSGTWGGADSDLAKKVKGS